jgi:predicted transcriptional regulator YheO
MRCYALAQRQKEKKYKDHGTTRLQSKRIHCSTFMSNDCKINLNCILCIKIDLVQKFHPAFMALIHVNEPKIEPHRISSECYPELSVGSLLLITVSIQDNESNFQNQEYTNF